VVSLGHGSFPNLSPLLGLASTRIAAEGPSMATSVASIRAISRHGKGPATVAEVASHRSEARLGRRARVARRAGPRLRNVLLGVGTRQASGLVATSKRCSIPQPASRPLSGILRQASKDALFHNMGTLRGRDSDAHAPCRRWECWARRRRGGCSLSGRSAGSQKCQPIFSWPQKAANASRNH
jgi:hypothetical protein